MTDNTSMGYSPFIYGNGDDDANLKQSHDRYHVYVNGDLVGNKVLLTQSEKIEDVASYLKRNGFRGFNAQVDGDHYTIDAETDVAEQMKEQLGVYLRIR